MLFGTVALLTAQTAMSHGTVTNPASRVYTCFSEGPENLQSSACQAAGAVNGVSFLYTWNGIAQGGANDNHQSVVPNGQLCSGGNPGYSGLDLARNDWVSHSVSTGTKTFVWTNTAMHITAYYDYYITRNGYNPSQALTWNDLEFVYRGPASPAVPTSTHQVLLPARSGRHVVYSVWQRQVDLSTEAFYACVDVDYGGGGSSSSGGSSSGGSSSGGSSGGGSCGVQYSAGTSYSQGQVVSSGGSNYICDVAGWCSLSAAWAYAPGIGTYWQSAWTSNGTCGGGASSSGGSSSGGSSSGGGSCSGLATWNSSSVYNGGNQVQHNGVKYQAKWWTQGVDPAQNSSQWAVWSNLGSC